MDGGMMDAMGPMMGWMRGLGLLGWLLVIGLLVTIVVLLAKTLKGTGSQEGPGSPPPGRGTGEAHG
jgi:hypothetical protein